MFTNIYQPKLYRKNNEKNSFAERLTILNILQFSPTLKKKKKVSSYVICIITPSI